MYKKRGEKIARSRNKNNRTRNNKQRQKIPNLHDIHTKRHMERLCIPTIPRKKENKNQNHHKRPRNKNKRTSTPNNTNQNIKRNQTLNLF